MALKGKTGAGGGARPRKAEGGARKAMGNRSPGWPRAVYDALRGSGVRHMAFVPDAGHSELIELFMADENVTSNVLTTEEEGIAIAAGAWLGGLRSVVLMQSSGVGNCINMLSLATIGFYCAHPGFWPLPNVFLGRAAAAASLGLINSFGNLGGFVGPYILGSLSDRTGGFGPGLLYLAVCSLSSGLLVLVVGSVAGLTRRRLS